jgi:hypothetical protein
VGFAFLITQSALNHTREVLMDRLEESTALLRDMLHRQIQADVDSLFGRFLPMLTPLQSEAAAREQQMGAQLDRLENLDAAFRRYDLPSAV